MDCKTIKASQAAEHGLGCANSAQCQKCGLTCTIYSKTDRDTKEPLGECENGGVFYWRVSSTFGISSRGPGSYDGTIGAKRKKALIDRQNELGRSQWERTDLLGDLEGVSAQNPTKGGPLDRKPAAKPTIIY